MIPEEAIVAAANAISESSGMRFDGFWSRIEDLEPEDRDYALAEARAALEAAAPFIRAQVLAELTANSPRLPSDVRNVVFEAVFDVVDKFNFPSQNCGTLKDVVEIGDVCGEVEKRIVAILRALAVTERGGE